MVLSRVSKVAMMCTVQVYYLLLMVFHKGSHLINVMNFRMLKLLSNS